MCVVSMVFDHYQDRFQPYRVYPSVPSPTFDPEVIKQLIQDFKKAVKAAKTVDKLTNQPDCEDPEKAKLVAEVERLQKVVDELLLQLKETRRKTKLEISM